MDTLEALQRRIRNAEDLRSIVRTMKTLAAVSIRQYERSIESLAEYNRTIEMGLEVVLAGMAREPENSERAAKGRVCAVVFGSDQGMCGQFNDHIARYALEVFEQMNVDRRDRDLVCVGMRAASALEDAGQNVDELFALPGSAMGITPLVQRLLLTIDRMRLEREIHRVYLVFNRPVTGVAYRPTSVRMLPISVAQLPRGEHGRWSGRSLPGFTMDPERLLAALIRQYLFVVLFKVLAESLASENTSRLLTMQMAEKNIDERLAEFLKTYHELRQSIITSEILDIISGIEALSDRGL